MILTSKELLEIYEAVVKPFGHPDPIGYMTRALLVSEGDPDYIDVQGKQGFQPVSLEKAIELTGVTEVQSLQSNIITTLSMDRILFGKYQTIDKMIIAFHFGEVAVDNGFNAEHDQFIKDINDTRSDTVSIMYPPFAKVEDVINLLDKSNLDKRLTKKELNFFEFLIKGA